MVGENLAREISYEAGIKMIIENSHPAFPDHPRPARKTGRKYLPKRVFDKPYLPKRENPQEDPGKA
jgi:hypothetical protein